MHRTETPPVGLRVAAPAVGFDDRVEAGLDQVRIALDEQIADRRARARELAPVHAALWRAVGDQIGGRLMRPRLTVAAYLGLGGTQDAAVAPVAAAQELLHTAMLVHDDLLDHDETRRGRPNVTGTARHRLTSAGITGRAADDQVLAAGVLGGDVALAAAFGLVAAAPVAPEIALQVLRTMTESVDTTVAGELLDVTGALSGPAEVDALRVAELKTAVYSCCAPLTVGAQLAGADDSVLGVLDLYGTAFGVAFQLLDDELGVFGDPALTGKSALSDLREGKRTELMRLTCLRADAAGRRVLDRHLGRADLDEAGAAELRTVIRDSGALDQARDVRIAAVERARAAVRDGLPGELADYLTGLTRMLAA